MLKAKPRIPLKKRKSKRLWIMSAAASLILVAVCLFLMISHGSAPTDSGTLTGLGRLATDYELAYKPNSLYDQPKPGEKEARLLAYIDHATWKFNYALEGFQGMPTDFEYSADAQLIARASESSKYIDPDFIVWQKQYQLVAPGKFSSDGRENTLSQQVDVDINQYANFTRSVYEQTQVRTTNELKLTFRVKAIVHGPVEDVVDNSVVEMTVPMIDSLWIVTGTPTAENKLRMVVAPLKPVVDYTPWILLSGALAVLSLVLTSVLLLGSREKDVQNQFAKETTKIFKQYGERLVRLENPLPYQLLAMIPIDGIAEIIKIADEISQPVFYNKADSMEEKKIEFYVFDSGRIYYMVIFGDMGREESL